LKWPIAPTRGAGAQEFLAGRRVERPRHLEAADLHDGDLGEREHAASFLEVAAERAVAVAQRQVAVHVVVGDDAGHSGDLDAPRAAAMVEAARREFGSDHPGDGQVGEAAEAGEDDPVANAFRATDPL
jgi:hypothetical protein